MPSADCPTCGARLPRGARFCAECGTRIGEDVQPETRFFGRPPRLPTGPLRDLRTRVAALVDAAAVRSGARRRLLALRSELSELAAARDRSVRELGEAVYAGDAAATDAARERVGELDGLIQTKEREMAGVASEAEQRIRERQLEVQPTMVDVPNVPEPYPPPDEGSPPQPAIVPEPMPPDIPEPAPPPDEGDPPQPAIVPEPTPGGPQESS